jgi:hypothetical protein
VIARVLIGVLAAVIVFASSVVIDYAAVRYQDAVRALEPHRAGRWSLGQFTAGAVGFVAAVQVGWWLLAFEGAGYYLGTVLAVERLRRDRGVAQ